MIPPNAILLVQYLLLDIGIDAIEADINPKLQKVGVTVTAEDIQLCREDLEATDSRAFLKKANMDFAKAASLIRTDDGCKLIRRAIGMASREQLRTILGFGE